MNRHRALRRTAVDLVVLLAYGAVAVVMTWPMAARSGTHLFAGSGDTRFHYWNCWWVRQALISGQSPFYTPYLFHPTGVSLVSNNFAWINIAVWLVSSPWLGGLRAYNLSLLLNLALCGFTAFLLTRDLTGAGRAAFLAGLVYQCWPYRLSQLDHPNLTSTQWIPLFMLFLVRVVRHGRWQDGVLAGIFLALTGYTRWQQLIPAAIVGGIYAFCSLPKWWPFQRRKVIIALLSAAVLAAVALGPPLMLLMMQQRSAPANLVKDQSEAIEQLDVLAYFLPSAKHPLLGALTEPLFERFYADRGGARSYACYLGVVALLAALVGTRTAHRAALPWVVMAVVLSLLALGPVLRLAGRLYPQVPMPYQLAARLYVVRLLRFPDRFNMFLALPVTVLAAYGLAHLLALADLRGRWVSSVEACFLGAAVLFEYLVVPVAVERPVLSPIYAQLAAEPGDFAVLNLPIHEQKSKLYMLAQTLHERPILQGHASRLPKGAYAYLDGHPWLGVLRQYNHMDPELTDVSRQLGSLAQNNVRYVILHKTQVIPDRLAHWRRYLLTAPRFEDQQIAVYATTPIAGRDFTLADELVPGLGPIRVLTSTSCLSPGHVFEVDVGWGATAAPGRDINVELAVVSEEGKVLHAEVFPLSPGWPTQDWPVNTVAWGYYMLHTPSSLSLGTHTVTLALVDPGTGARLSQRAVLGRLQVSEPPCAFPVPSAAVGVNALFGDHMRLFGYELHREGARLELTLHWRSERRMETDYKIFVHVFDPATAVPVAQDDAMPRRWSYPTTFWGLGEVVVDTVPVSLKEARAGVYGVAVGIYDPATMERLLVLDGTGQVQTDGRLVLPGERIEVATSEP